MKAKAGVIAGILALFGVGGVLWARKAKAAETHNCPAGYHWDEDAQSCLLDEVLPGTCAEGYHWDEDEEACVPDDVILPQGTEFSNFSAHYPDQVAPGQDFVATLYFAYKGEGGVYDIGIYLYLGYGYISSQSTTLPASADWAGMSVDIWFSGGPLSALPSGTNIDAFRFIKKLGIPFDPSVAGQMEITGIDSGAIKVVAAGVGRRNVG